jgi:hypothetical protein
MKKWPEFKGAVCAKIAPKELNNRTLEAVEAKMVALKLETNNNNGYSTIAKSHD